MLLTWHVSCIQLQEEYAAALKTVAACSSVGLYAHIFYTVAAPTCSLCTITVASTAAHGWQRASLNLVLAYGLHVSARHSLA